MTDMRSAGRGVDEIDVLLLDGLHANPRISFEKLGPVLGISAATASRRWQRLSESGRAWVSSVPGPHLDLVGAIYEVRAVPGQIPEVAHRLARIPQVISVYYTDGGFDLQTILLARDMPTLGRLLSEHLPSVPGIARAQAHVGIEWYSGVHWHLGAIDALQKQSVEDRAHSNDRTVRNRTFEPADEALFLALQHDGRARYRDLARELGTSEHLVRRQLDSLIRRGMIGFRTDFARRQGGWSAQYVLWLSVPHNRVTQVGLEIAGWPETRICMSTVGVANMMVMSQVHTIPDLYDVLERVRRTQSDVVVVDQRLVLQAVKSWGRLLDSDGHAIDVVPVNPWGLLDEHE
ncbi:AsnC family transcriptional regulator [Nocardia sp. ET3-3]|uniref:AsnC family transcriptional regulator n=1 Tax=Nocardia terrae TaxID=2675851 RepID=A0A7K1UTH1_9NOCA|nr:Lrp/AsnC family transcriptional regulator [Nocardia terrae]MVU77158.1 AsnC family transcriptional regulator [Nocardia terrae]